MLAENRVEALRRLKSIEGHVRGVIRMIEEGQRWIDVVRQTLAIQGALEKLNLLILEEHLQECMSTAINSTDAAQRERAIRELLEVFETSTKL